MTNPKATERRIEREARLTWVPLGLMRTPTMAQREIKPGRVDHIAANMDLEQIGTPTVNKRGGLFYILDAVSFGVFKTFRVHRLVAEVFIGPRPVGMQVRHLDGNSLNNALSNLAYGTGSENQQDSVRHGTHRETRKTYCKRGHEFTPDNIRPNGTTGRRCVTCDRIHRKARYETERAGQRFSVRQSEAS